MPPCAPLPGSLTFVTSGGLGNQYYGLQIAAWLAIALRRGTLVVPPILRHFKLGGPAGRGCESVDAAAAADGSQREHATRAQQIWLDMERRGVADSWRLLLDFGGLGPRLRVVDSAEYRRGAPKARVAFRHCGRLASGWKLDRFQQVAHAAPAAAEISVGATFNNIDTDALTLCEFTAPCERAVAARALRWRLAPSLKRGTRLALHRALGAGAETRMHAAHIRSGYGETEGAAWKDHVAATVRPLRAALARSRVGRPLVYVAADVPWDTLMGAHVDGVADLCARALRRQRRALRALNRRVGELGEGARLPRHGGGAHGVRRRRMCARGDLLGEHAALLLVLAARARRAPRRGAIACRERLRRRAARRHAPAVRERMPTDARKQQLQRGEAGLLS